MHPHRRTQCADGRNEVLLIQPSIWSRRLVTSKDPSSGLWTLAHRRLLSRGKRGTWPGSLRMSWLAVYPSASVRDDPGATVLCPRATTIIAQRQRSHRRTADDGAGPTRGQRVRVIDRTSASLPRTTLPRRS